MLNYQQLRFDNTGTRSSNLRARTNLPVIRGSFSASGFICSPKRYGFNHVHMDTPLTATPGSGRSLHIRQGTWFPALPGEDKATAMFPSSPSGEPSSESSSTRHSVWISIQLNLFLLIRDAVGFIRGIRLLALIVISVGTEVTFVTDTCGRIH